MAREPSPPICPLLPPSANSPDSPNWSLLTPFPLPPPPLISSLDVPGDPFTPFQPQIQGNEYTPTPLSAFPPPLSRSSFPDSAPAGSRWPPTLLDKTCDPQPPIFAPFLGSLHRTVLFYPVREGDAYSPRLIQPAARGDLGHCRVCEPWEHLAEASELSAWFDINGGEYADHMCLKHGISPEFHRPYAPPEYENRIREVADGRQVEDSLCSFCGTWVCSVVWTLTPSATNDTPIADWSEWWRHARACHPDSCSPHQFSKLTATSATSPITSHSLASLATSNFFPVTRFPYEPPTLAQQPPPLFRSDTELFPSTNPSMTHAAPPLAPTHQLVPRSDLPNLASPARAHSKTSIQPNSLATASNLALPKGNHKVGLSRQSTVPSSGSGSAPPDERPDPSRLATLRPRLRSSTTKRARTPTWKVLDSAGLALAGGSEDEDEGGRSKTTREMR